MAGATVSSPTQILGLVPGTAMTGPNTRALGGAGPFGTSADAVVFSDGGTGVWLPGPGKVLASGVLLVSASSTGNSVHPSAMGSVTVMTVVGGDPRVSEGT